MTATSSIGTASAGEQLDDAQAMAVATVGPCVVVGAPGTGKTATVLAWAARRLADPSRAAPVVVLVPSRRGAARVRDLLSSRVSATLRDPAVRTPQSLAWAVLREAAARDGDPPPRLVTGAESDAALAEMLAGHDAGHAAGPRWPDTVPVEVRATRAFRSDLRELWARLVERGQGPDELRDLGRHHDRREWVAAAQVLEERLRVSGLRGDNAWDPAEIVDEAAARLAVDEGLRTWAHQRVGALAVDDAHDLTSSGWRLVWAVSAPGTDLLICGDPDLATQTFRGARPTAFADLPRTAGRPGIAAPVVVLATVWRCGEALARIHRVTEARIGVVTAVHRRPVPVAQPGRSRVVVCRDTVEEAATVAAAVRAWRHGPGRAIAWSGMAVVVRSLGRADAVRRALAQAGVPCHVPGPGVALRDQPAAAVLLRAALVATDPDMLDGPTLGELACGPLGSTDMLRWRRLVRTVRASQPLSGPGTERAVGPAALLAAAARDIVTGGHPSDAPEVVVDVTGPGTWVGLSPVQARPVMRIARILAAGRAARVAGPTAVLWAVWAAAGVDRRWRAAALGQGPDASAADTDLDAVIALFDVAERFFAGHPGAGLGDLAAHVASSGVADDRLSGVGPGDAVTITTPAGAAGFQWDAVAVCGVQDGVWPDLRVRGSLLATADLVDVLDGREGVLDQTRATLDDEARLFLVAVSRARSDLLVTAVAGDDERPSEFCRLIAGPDVVLDAAGSGPAPAWHDHTLESVVVALRRLVGAGAALRHQTQGAADADAEPHGASAHAVPPDAAAAARLLARLAAAGVPGADPDQWWWTSSPSDATPSSGEPGVVAVPVRASPSALDAFAVCPLRWYLGRIGGDTGDDTARRLGELIHAAADRHPTGGLAELTAFVDAGWADLGLAAGWIDERQRRRAREMLRRLADWLAGREAPLATEVQFDAVLAGVRVVGKIDRVEPTGDGAVRLVDFKTGAPKSKAAAADNPQLASYQLAVDSGAVQGSTRSSGAVLVHVGGTTATAAERPQSALTPEDRSRVGDLLGRFAQAVGDGSFEATPGEHCERCQVRTSCPAGPAGGHHLPVDGYDRPPDRDAAADRAAGGNR